MNFLPVIHRELCVASRRRETWRLRLVFGLAAMLAFSFGMFWPHVSVQERGKVVLICLAIAAFVLSLFTGAYLTADAVTAEKREGTLGLLFLTPLDGWQIILGKISTHSLQVGYALVGAFPVFFLPILLGSVLWAEVIRVLLVLLLTLALSLACGMFYSTILRDVRNAVLATAITMLLLTLLPWLQVLISEMAQSPWPLYGLPQLSPMTALMFAFDSNYRVHAAQPGSGSILFWGSIAWLALANVASAALSGWLLPRIWRKDERGAPQPEAGPSPREHPRRLLPAWALPMDSAPLLWLAARDLREARWLRVVRWLALVFFASMLVSSAASREGQEGWFIAAFCACYGLHLLTRLQWLMTATCRLHEDRQSGALEAILATPVSDAELIHAHSESFTRGFRRPLRLLLATNLTLELFTLAFFRHLHMDDGVWVIFSAFFLGGMAVTWADYRAMRWLSLREALRPQSQMKAVGRVFLLLFVLPWLAFALAWIIAIQSERQFLVAFIFFVWAGACTVYAHALAANAERTLRQRELRRLISEG
jgi:ABC-type multidrug transport system permease subunit